jgi:hypothetical protein
MAITGRAELAERSTTREPGNGGSPLPRLGEEQKNKLKGKAHEIFDQGCGSGSGSGSVLDPYSIGSVDPDPDP